MRGILSCEFGQTMRKVRRLSAQNKCACAVCRWWAVQFSREAKEENGHIENANKVKPEASATVGGWPKDEEDVFSRLSRFLCAYFLSRAHCDGRLDGRTRTEGRSHSLAHTYAHALARSFARSLFRLSCWPLHRRTTRTPTTSTRTTSVLRLHATHPYLTTTLTTRRVNSG